MNLHEWSRRCDVCEQQTPELFSTERKQTRHFPDNGSNKPARLSFLHNTQNYKNKNSELPLFAFISVAPSYLSQLCFERALVQDERGACRCLILGYILYTLNHI
jgi:hypothetical protein